MPPRDDQLQLAEKGQVGLDLPFGGPASDRRPDLPQGQATGGSRQSARIDGFYAVNGYVEPGESRRLLSPNGRLGDLLHTALNRGEPEAGEIAKRLKKWKVRLP